MLSDTTDLSTDRQLAQLEKDLLDAEHEFGEQHKGLIEPLEKLAYRCHSLGLYDEAEQKYKRALTLRQRFSPDDRAGIVALLHGLAILMRIQNRFSEAEPFYAQTLALTRQDYGERHIETATRQNYLAGLYFAWQRFDLAEKLVESSLSIYKEFLGEYHELVGIASMGLTLICNKQGKLSEANEHFKRAGKILPAAPTGVVMVDFKDLAASLVCLSREKYKQGKIEEAETLFRYALVVETNSLWPGHRLVADNIQLLGDLYRSQRMPLEAEFLYQKAMDIRKQVMGPQHLDVAMSANSLGSLLVENRRFEEAEAILKEAVDIREQAGFPPLLANSLRAYAACLRQLNRSNEADECEKRAQHILEKYNPS